MSRRTVVSARELRTLRIVVAQGGPGAGGAPLRMLDITIDELALLVRGSGGVRQYDFQDSDTGSYVRVEVSLPPPAKTR